MPYIHIKTSKKLSDGQKDALSAGLGQKISLLPGKSEAYLMVDISDGHTMYLSGKKGDLAFAGIEIFGSAKPADQKRLTEAVFNALQEHAGLGAGQVYVTFTEREHWGMHGSLV